MDKFIKHPDIGIITLHPSKRSLRAIFKIKNGSIILSYPFATKESDILEIIETYKEKIKILQQRNPPRFIQNGDAIKTHSFDIIIELAQHRGFKFELTNSVLKINCPQDTQFEKTATQEILKKGILRFIKRAAQQYLPARLAQLAEEVNVNYQACSISNGKQKLGACNSKQKITLSYYLMFYPDHLIDYVIYHELAHLQEMNHGRNFHNLCNRFCNGQEKSYQKELKKFRLFFN